MKYLKLIGASCIFFMFFTINIQNAWSLSTDLEGEWVQDGGVFLPAYLTFYHDGKLKITGVTTNTYKINRKLFDKNEVEITIHGFWGGEGVTSTHKYSIDNGILSFDPGIYGVEHFKRSN